MPCKYYLIELIYKREDLGRNPSTFISSYKRIGECNDSFNCRSNFSLSFLE